MNDFTYKGNVIQEVNGELLLRTVCLWEFKITDIIRKMLCGRNYE